MAHVVFDACALYACLGLEHSIFARSTMVCIRNHEMLEFAHQATSRMVFHAIIHACVGFNARSLVEALGKAWCSFDFQGKLTMFLKGHVSDRA